MIEAIIRFICSDNSYQRLKQSSVFICSAFPGVFGG